MLELLWIALSSGGIAVTVTKSVIFAELREAFALLVVKRPWPVFKLATLVRCPYCAAHWVVGLEWLLWTPHVRWSVLMFFATVTVATTVAGMMSRAYSFAS